MPDVVEALFGIRESHTADGGASPFVFQKTPGGLTLSFIIRDGFPWAWRLIYSLHLHSWSELPGEVERVFVPVSHEPPLTQVTITWPSVEEKAFFRVEVWDPSGS